MRKTVWILLFLAVVVGAGQTPSDIDQRRMRLAQENEIREAAFRYVFHHNASGLQEDAHVFCLLIQGHDPTDSFLMRFRDEKALVLRARDCVYRRSNSVRDRESGREGLLFEATEIYWSSNDEVYVDGSYYAAPLSAAGYSWRIVRQHSKWVVKSEHMHWIS